MPLLKIDRPFNSKWIEFWEVQSHSDPTKAYIVARKADGTWGCSCPHWTGHFPRPTCKHIREVLDANGVSDNRAPVMAPAKLEKNLSRFAVIEV